MQFQIDNMTCGGCARSITKAIHSVDPQAKVDIDFPMKRVGVESRAEISAVAAALQHAGYPPSPDDRRLDRSRDLRNQENPR